MMRIWVPAGDLPQRGASTLTSYAPSEKQGKLVNLYGSLHNSLGLCGHLLKCATFSGWELQPSVCFSKHSESAICRQLPPGTDVCLCLPAPLGPGSCPALVATPLSQKGAPVPVSGQRHGAERRGAPQSKSSRGKALPRHPRHHDGRPKVGRAQLQTTEVPSSDVEWEILSQGCQLVLLQTHKVPGSPGILSDGRCVFLWADDGTIPRRVQVLTHLVHPIVQGHDC